MNDTPWARFKGTLITQLNVLATLVLAWIIQQPQAPTETVVAWFPEGYQPIVRLVMPVLWGLVIQWAIVERDARSGQKAVAKAVENGL